MVGALAAENTTEQIAAAPVFVSTVEKAIIDALKEDESIKEFFLNNLDSLNTLLTALAGLAHAAAREPAE